MISFVNVNNIIENPSRVTPVQEGITIITTNKYWIFNKCKDFLSDKSLKWRIIYISFTDLIYFGSPHLTQRNKSLVVPSYPSPTTVRTWQKPSRVTGGNEWWVMGKRRMLTLPNEMDYEMKRWESYGKGQHPFLILRLRLRRATTGERSEQGVARRMGVMNRALGSLPYSLWSRVLSYLPGSSYPFPRVILAPLVIPREWPEGKDDPRRWNRMKCKQPWGASARLSSFRSLRSLHSYPRPSRRRPRFTGGAGPSGVVKRGPAGRGWTEKESDGECMNDERSEGSPYERHSPSPRAKRWKKRIWL